MTEFTGYEFNQLYANIKFCKVLTNLSTIKPKFDGYISFFSHNDFEKIIFKEPDIKYFVDVIIPSDANIIIYSNYYYTTFKTDKITYHKAKSIIEYENFDKILINNSDAIKFINSYNITTKLLNIIVKHNALNITKYDKKYQNLQIAKYVVKSNPALFEYIREDLQTFDIIRMAVIHNSQAYNNICNLNKLTSKQIELIHDIMVGNDIYCLQTIFKQFQTYNLCIRVISICGSELQHVRLDLHTTEMYILAIKSDYKAFEYTLGFLQTLDMCKTVVKIDGLLLKYVRHDLFPQVYKIAIKSNGLALQHINPDTQTLEMCKIAIKSNNNAIKYVSPMHQTEFYNYGWKLFGLKSKYKN